MGDNDIHGYVNRRLSLMVGSEFIPICVVGNFFVAVTGTVAVTTLLLSGCGNCGKWASWGCGAAFQYSVVDSVSVVTSSLFICI